MKKTAIKQIIEKLQGAQKSILLRTNYADGYDGALKDVLTVCKSFLPEETQQIIDAFNQGFREGEGETSVSKKDVSEFGHARYYYDSNYEDSLTN